MLLALKFSVLVHRQLAWLRGVFVHHAFHIVGRFGNVRNNFGLLMVHIYAFNLSSVSFSSCSVFLDSIVGAHHLSDAQSAHQNFAPSNGGSFS